MCTLFMVGAVVATLSACGSAATPMSAAQNISAGVVAQSSGKLALATTYYTTALRLRPRSVVALFDLGQVLQLDGSTAQAASDYRASLVGDPTFVPALYNLATLVTKTRPLESAALYHDVISVAPRNADAHFNLGFILIALGHRAAGNAQINIATALDPALKRRLAPAASSAPS